MTQKPTPAWPLPVMAMVQAVFGAGFVTLLWGLEAPWNAGSAVVAAIASLAGLLLLALATRNCVRLWRVPPREASWRLVIANGAGGSGRHTGGCRLRVE